MKIGDLVYKLDKWVQYNSWMKDIELDYSDKSRLGIVVEIPTEKFCRVLWPCGKEEWIRTAALQRT